MMKIPGILIRISRMDQSRKLTDLAFQCHISASYLSQIETGKAQPDPQILRQLAKALDLDYTIDQNWLLPARQRLDQFIRTALLSDLDAAREQALNLQRLRKRYVASPLALDYHLAFFVYAIMIKKQRGFSQQKRLLTSIRESFSDTQAALFELACGISDLSQDLIEAEIHLHRCLKINSEPLFNALGHYYASLLYFKKGKSLLASEHCANASRMFNQANCYPFLIYCHIQYAAILAMQEYDRPAAILTSMLESKTLNLMSGTRSVILCKLGYCCINHGRYEQAEAVLERFGDIPHPSEELDFLRCLLKYKKGEIGLMKNQIPADKSYSEPISDLMKVMKAAADQDPRRDKLLITLLKQGRKKLDQHQKRFYLTLLIDYYEEKRSYAKKCQCLQRLAELLQGGEL
ncbi:helix-turn-helix domain-containing protein [Holdemania filiformis]|uniref:helix-turn-helix domain-containing protein n=1 Tax=Holdemania filiformis TaxID=61171 RepID=UPI002431CF41|nr:helix-turn-helix domain-containing protein [Holdemania filiformis]